MFLYIRQNLIIVSKKWVWRQTFGLKVRLDQIKKPADVPLVTTRVGVSHSRAKDDDSLSEQIRRGVFSEGE